MESIFSEDVYLPGDKICLSNHARSGHGTYSRDGFIRASLIGRARIDHEVLSPSGGSESNSKATSHHHSLPVISVKTIKDNVVVIPHVGSLVIGKITNVNPRYAKCSIIAVNNIIIKEKFSGQINRKDIRATEKDKIEISKSFRCGDVIIARVISLGDTNSYFLSCAENELGVIIAYSEAGYRMIPISWCEMQSPQTYVKEYRKVAKVQPEFINYNNEQQSTVKAEEIIQE